MVILGHLVWPYGTEYLALWFCFIQPYSFGHPTDPASSPQYLNFLFFVINRHLRNLLYNSVPEPSAPINCGHFENLPSYCGLRGSGCFNRINPR